MAQGRALEGSPKLTAVLFNERGFPKPGLLEFGEQRQASPVLGLGCE